MVPFPEHDLATPAIDLGDGAVLLRAEADAWVRAWTVYRGIDEDFSQGFEARAEDLVDIPVAHWLELDGIVVAGLALLPNGIGDPFLVPPFDDPDRVVQAVLPLLKEWSGGAIRAQGMDDDWATALGGSGFVLEETRRWMIRPIPADGQVSAGVEAEPVRADDTQEIAELLHRSFQGLPTSDGRRELASFVEAVDRHLSGRAGSDIPDGASALVRGSDGAALAVCLVNEHRGLPTIQFLATVPEARGRGLASGLVHRAMGELVGVGDWVKLAVTVGTPAEGLYERLGFKGGPAISSLVLE